MNKNKFFLHPAKFAAASVTWVFCAVIGITLVTLHLAASAALFLGISLLFLIVSLYEGTVISVSADGVLSSVCGKKLQYFPWAKIAEIGVINTKVFGNTKKQSPGALYIYISPEKTTEEERFNMALKWPPKGRISMQYTQKRLDSIRMYWDGQITAYNVDLYKN